MSKSDLEIAFESKMKKISDITKDLDLFEDDVKITDIIRLNYHCQYWNV